MEDTSKVSEDTTFTALKYKRYASVDIIINNYWLLAGSIYWIDDAGQFHRENGPAVEFISGTKWWLKHGKLHRKDGPAVEVDNGHKEWYIDGKFIKSGRN